MSTLTPIRADAPAEPATRAHVLCVDDESRVLEGLSLVLRRRFELTMATNATDALQTLGRDPSIAVILTDMRMPGIDGAQFLLRAREIAPDAVRLVLTGQADVKAAVAAVNDGRIFRFLTKPCPPPVLVPALEAAVEQHRLVSAERVLLEQTLHGALKALCDVLALASPAAFGRATRVSRHVADIAGVLEFPDSWMVKVAAMVSQIGFVTLPADVAERVHRGQPLTADEAEQVAKLPYVAETLLANIPRLEPVRKILTASVRPIRRLAMGADAKSHQLMRNAQALRIAIDYDDLLARGRSPELAIGEMRRNESYLPEVLDALATLTVSCAGREEIQQIAIAEIAVGMVIADDVHMTTGTMLVARGYEVTPSFVARARQFRPGTVKEPVRILVRRPG